MSNIPISAQMCPISHSRIERLKEAGLDTISFNIEIYDEEIRNEMMPEKARLYSTGVYLEAIKKAVGIFGRNQVSSWIIAGLESPESTLAGCKAICENGGIPHVAIFRPLTGTPLESRTPPDINEVVALYKEFKKLLLQYSLNPFEHKAGCIRCGGCSVLKEIMEGN